MPFQKFMSRWYRRRQLFLQDVPGDVMSWLFDASSLTARLIRTCKGKFSVELISQQVNKPTLDEAFALDMRTDDCALIRQVRLYCNDTVVVYARTVIPLTTLTGAQRRYANLGNRPLGAMLFADRTMKRNEVMVTKLLPGDSLYEIAGAKSKKEIWGRRSAFYVGGKPLLVSEYYLPALFKN